MQNLLDMELFDPAGEQVNVYIAGNIALAVVDVDDVAEVSFRWPIREAAPAGRRIGWDMTRWVLVNWRSG